MNHAAVRAVSMHTLNRQRANIVLSSMFANGKVLAPREVSRQERVFERDGILRWKEARAVGWAKIGVSLQSILDSMRTSPSATGTHHRSSETLAKLLHAFENESSVVWMRNQHVLIVLKEKASSESHLKAWALALWVTHKALDNPAASSTDETTLQLLTSSLGELSSRWHADVVALKAAGWNVETASLETASARRIRVDTS